jgi:hypothetical protein
VRLIKMLGLAVLAVVGAMAYVGAGSASADTLCESNTNPCPLEKSYALPVHITGSSTEAAKFLVNGEAKVECNSKILIKVTKNIGEEEGMKATLTDLKFSGCAGLCTGVKEEKSENLPYYTYLNAIEQHLLVSDGGGSFGIPSILFTECTVGGVKVSCLYEVPSKAMLMSFKGGNPAAHLTVTKYPMNRVGHSMLCPVKIEWDTLYKVTSPEPLWLVKTP